MINLRNVHGIETKKGMAYFIYAGGGVHLYLFVSPKELKFQPVCVEETKKNDPIFLPERPGKDEDPMCLHCHEWMQAQHEDSN